MSWHEGFNQSGFSKFINSVPIGRIFRVVAGTAFHVAGYVYRSHGLGVASMAWSVVPLSADANRPRARRSGRRGQPGR